MAPTLLDFLRVHVMLEKYMQYFGYVEIHFSPWAEGAVSG